MKENEKEYAQIEMANALRRQMEVEKEVELIEQKIATKRESMLNLQKNGLLITELVKLEEHISFLENQLLERRRGLKISVSLVNEQQELLSSKLKEEKTWYSIKETRLEEYRRGMKMREQNELDSLSSVRAFQNAVAKG